MVRYSRVVVHRHIHINQKRYGILAFLFDVFMTIITGGFWLIWVFVREMRRR